MSFIAELKRRNVFRVGATYAVLAWLLMQVAAIVLPAFDAPRWLMQAFLFFLVLGFVLTLLLAWLYELTPEGFKLTTAADPAADIRHHTGQKLNLVLIAGLALLLATVMIDQYLLEDAEAVTESIAVAVPASDSPGLTAPSASISDKSIAVLPFDDFDAGGEDAWFADGLTEEILNALTRTPDLLVTSRTSSFQYKDQAVNVQDVARTLGVAHILEGSVRRSATRLRVTVQLIRAADGFHLWSENYDRTPDDIIAVQEDIALQIALALQTAMDPAALREMVRSGTNSVAAYTAYLRALALQQGLGRNFSREAYEQIEIARQLDPGFSLAHSRAAIYWQQQLEPNLIRTGDSFAEMLAPAAMLALHEERIRQAIATASGVESLLHRQRQARVNMQLRVAFGYAQQALAADPAVLRTDLKLGSMVENLLSLVHLFGESVIAESLIDSLVDSVGTTQNELPAGPLVNWYYYIGEIDKGREFAQRARKSFPFNELLAYQAHRLLLEGAYVEEAREVLDSIAGTELTEVSLRLMRLRQACAEGDFATAARLFSEARDSGWDGANGWQIYHLMGQPITAAELLVPLDQPDTLYSLSRFLVYPYFDINAYPNLKAVLERDGVPLPVYKSIPYACPAPQA